jgi:hypothetical protein
MSDSISPAQKEQLEDMLGVLAHVRLRPGMWIGSIDESALRAFTTGFWLAANLLGTYINKEVEVIWTERGWKKEGSMDYIHLLTDSGMSNDEVALEVFTVLILQIQRQYELTGNKVLETHSQMRHNITEKGYELSADLAKQMESLEKDLGIFKVS